MRVRISPDSSQREQRRVHAICARPFNHIGVGQASHFAVPSFARQITEIKRGHRDATIEVGDLSPVRDFLHVADVARGYRLLLERGEVGTPYNVCSGQPVSVRSILEQLLELSDVNAEVRMNPQRLRAAEIPWLVVVIPLGFADWVGNRKARSGLPWRRSSLRRQSDDRAGQRLRLGIVLDSPLEGWTSMDYVGEMLLDTLNREHSDAVSATALQPFAPRIFGRFAGPLRPARHRLDRFVARCIVYPIAAALQRDRYDAFHVVDHSYAHVAHSLPGNRTGIYCHDLDALRPLFSRSFAPHLRILAWSILRALQGAAVVFHSTDEVRRQITAKGLLDERKLIHAPYGVAPEFSSTNSLDPGIERLLPPGLFLLYVGSDIPRKRLDLLLRSFAGVCADNSSAYLVIAGSPLSTSNEVLLQKLGVGSRVVKIQRLTRSALAYVYRRAILVVAPSAREGFGLPVIEALACGTRVLASDIPVFREVGGVAVTYVASADPANWAAAILGLLDEQKGPSREARLAKAADYSWTRHGAVILAAYQSLT